MGKMPMPPQGIMEKARDEPGRAATNHSNVAAPSGRVRLYYSGMPYCALSGLGRFDSTAPQGVAPWPCLLDTALARTNHL